MPRFYLKLSLPIAIIFLTASLTARALGTTQPSNPALRGFTEGCEDQPQPCWYGIVPRITSVWDMQALLEAQGYTITIAQTGTMRQLQAQLDSDNRCRVLSNVYHDTVTSIEVFTCRSLSIGDFMLLAGMPEIGLGCDVYAHIQPTLKFRPIHAIIEVGGAYNPTALHQVTAFYPIQHLSVDDLKYAPVRGTVTTWHGSASILRYQTLANKASLRC